MKPTDEALRELGEVVAALEMATPGDWQVLCEQIPWTVDSKSGNHEHRRIFTEWHHPQMKGPLGVVNIATGIGDSATGGKPVMFVHISEADAQAIVAATNYLRKHHAALASLAARVEGAERERDALRADLSEMYEAMPALPITQETADAATDWMTRFCIDFQPAIDALIARGESGK